MSFQKYMGLLTLGGGNPDWANAQRNINPVNGWEAPATGWLITTYMVPVARERRTNGRLYVNGQQVALLGLGNNDLNGNFYASCTLPVQEGDKITASVDDTNNSFTSIFVPAG